MAGLDGIKHKIEPFAYVEENVYEMDEKRREEIGIDMLPENLGEALDELERDKVVKEALGGAYRNFVGYKRKEWEEYLDYLEAKNLPKDTKNVTEWELERYFFI